MRLSSRQALRQVAYTLIYLMLLNSGMSVAAAYHAHPEDSQRILLCTPQGFKWVDISELSDTGAGTNSTLHQCPLCGSNTASDDDIHLLTDLLAVFNPRLQSVSGFALSTPKMTGDIRLHHQPTRAPPSQKI